MSHSATAPLKLPRMPDHTLKSSLYGPTALGPGQIRLLFLHPGHESDSLTGHLETVDLGNRNCPPYEALSYEWGAPEKPCIFSTADKLRVNITESLHDALRDLRNLPAHPGASISSRVAGVLWPKRQAAHGQRIIWADAICINQDDLEERESQVSMMGAIYRRATRVITYIGPEKDASAEGVALAANLLRAFEMRARVDLQDASGLSEAGLPPITHRSWKALKELCLRRWAGRCWCAQEFLCNKNLILMCGRTVFPDWATLLSVVRLVYARQLPAEIIPGRDEDPDSLRDCLISLINLRSPLRYTSNPGRKQLLKLLQSFHPFQASDPRDKIYSLLGHSADHDDLGVVVDYTISPEELYTTVAAEMALKYQDIRFLLSNLHHKSLPNLPSWVPDWSTWYFGSDLGGTGYDHTLFASGHSKASLRPIGPGLNTKLAVSGCLIDTITWVGDNILPYYTTHEEPVASRRREWITKQLEIVRALDPYPYLDATSSKIGNLDSLCRDISTVLWRTLISNTNHNESAAKDDYVEYFEAHYNYAPGRAQDTDQHGSSGASEGTENPIWNLSEKARHFCDAVRWRSRYRRVAVTRNGYFGAVPETAEVGDVVCMFHGGRHLFVVRPSEPAQGAKDGGQVAAQSRGLGAVSTTCAEFRHVGHAYVHGLMSGDILKEEWYVEGKGDIVLV